MKTISKIVSGLSAAALLSLSVTADAAQAKKPGKPPVKQTVKKPGRSCQGTDNSAKDGETKLVETGPGEAHEMTCHDGTWVVPLEPLSPAGEHPNQ